MFTVGEKWRYPGSDTTWEVAEVSPLSNFSNHDDMLRRLPPETRAWDRRAITIAKTLVEQLRLERGTLERAPDESRGPGWRRYAPGSIDRTDLEVWKP